MSNTCGLKEAHGFDPHKPEEEARRIGYYVRGAQVMAGQSHPNALVIFREVARKGYLPAMFHVGLMYEFGRGTPVEMKEAVTWYRKAAESHYEPAQKRLALKTAELDEVARREERQVAADDVGAMYDMGEKYLKGEGILQSDEKALLWFLKAAELDSPAAQGQVGAIVAMTNKAEAVTWYLKAAAAGDSEAQNRLGVCYYDGVGIATNRVEAVRWYREAAEAGQHNAMWNLGQAYKNGRGIDKDEGEALRWYRLAAQHGNKSAFKSIADLYAEGYGVTNNREDVQSWYEAGWNAEKATNLTEAVKWYDKAAEGDHIFAQTKLAMMLRKGDGVPKDVETAAAWFESAAVNGEPLAQFWMGFICQSGEIAATDEEAAEWYLKSAEQGYAVAQNNLGALYANGRGVPQSEADALYWYGRAMASEGFGAGIKIERNFNTLYTQWQDKVRDGGEGTAWAAKGTQSPEYYKEQWNKWAFRDGVDHNQRVMNERQQRIAQQEMARVQAAAQQNGWIELAQGLNAMAGQAGAMRAARHQAKANRQAVAYTMSGGGSDSGGGYDKAGRYKKLSEKLDNERRKNNLRQAKAKVAPTAGDYSVINASKKLQRTYEQEMKRIEQSSR